jgi:hypothetical protein
MWPLFASRSTETQRPRPAPARRRRRRARARARRWHGRCWWWWGCSACTGRGASVRARRTRARLQPARRARFCTRRSTDRPAASSTSSAASPAAQCKRLLARPASLPADVAPSVALPPRVRPARLHLAGSIDKVSGTWIALLQRQMAELYPGEPFPRVDWVAVPKASRARRANRRRRRAAALQPRGQHERAARELRGEPRPGEILVSVGAWMAEIPLPFH